MIKGFDDGYRTLYNKDNLLILEKVTHFRLDHPVVLNFLPRFFNFVHLPIKAHFFQVYFLLIHFFLELLFIQPVLAELHITHKSREAFP